jgi:hypothetical protein
LLLDYSYYSWIAPHYSYADFSFTATNTSAILLSYVMVIAVGLLCPSGTMKPSVFIAGLLFMISYIPTSVLFAYGGFPFEPLAWLSAVFALLFLLINKETMLFRNFTLAQTQAPLISIVMAILVAGFALLLLTYGFKVPSLTLDVYGTRATYKQSLGQSSALVAYVVSWMGNVIVPFLSVWALINRKVAIFTITIVLQLTIFAIAGFKSQLLAIPFIFVILVGARWRLARMLHYVAGMFCIALFVGFIIDYKCNFPVVNGIFVRRFFFLPAQIYYYYFDFFLRYPHTFLSQNLLKGVVDYPYLIDVPYIIGREYLGSADADANANMWADAFANFGAIGYFLYLLLLWLVLKIIDNISAYKNNYFVYTLLAMPVFSLSNSALLTTMLTHGLLVAVLLICLLPREYALTECGVAGQ